MRSEKAEIVISSGSGGSLSSVSSLTAFMPCVGRGEGTGVATPGPSAGVRGLEAAHVEGRAPLPRRSRRRVRVGVRDARLRHGRRDVADVGETAVPFSSLIFALKSMKNASVHTCSLQKLTLVS